MQQSFAMRMRGRALGGGAPPLDGYTTDLWGAWSTRQLLSSYTGNVIRVQRSSDSAQQDIGTIGGELDESALTSFVGANDGYIVTYYDQSGNGRNLTAVNTNQRIVSSGAVERLSVFAANNHHGSAVSNGYLSSTRPNAITLFVTINTVDALGVFATKEPNSPTSYVGVWQNGSGLSNRTTNAWVNNVPAGATRDTLHDAVAVGAERVVTVDSNSIPWFSPTQWLLFGYQTGGGDFVGTWLDAVAYDATGLSNRADIDSALRVDL